MKLVAGQSPVAVGVECLVHPLAHRGVVVVVPAKKGLLQFKKYPIGQNPARLLFKPQGDRAGTIPKGGPIEPKNSGQDIRMPTGGKRGFFMNIVFHPPPPSPRQEAGPCKSGMFVPGANFGGKSKADLDREKVIPIVNVQA